MKELTYEDWQKDTTPRMMWVWNDDEKERVKRKVLFIFKLDEDCEWKVLTLNNKETCANVYKHCAEIEEERRMTNKELSRWLRESPTREYKCGNHRYIYNNYVYKEGCENEDVDKEIVIRENYGEWKEPLPETEEI